MNRLTRLSSLAAGLLGAALISGCTGEAMGPPDPQFAKASTTSTEFTECSFQAYSATSGSIGPEGGRLKTGSHTLYVPAGALDANTFITMEARSGTISRVSLGPEGLTFNKDYPARLLTRYTDCWIDAGAKQGIAYVDDDLRIVETTPSYDDRFSQTVDAKLSHFSDYVLLSTYAVVY
ncbi:MAG: hypothetical protein ACREMZ_02840 [Gemmatimonadales bacterium]